MKEKKTKKEGIVLENLSNLKFRVKMEDGEEIIAYLAGRLRQFKINILPGDKVIVEVSPYDKKRGRIIWRGKIK